MGTTWDGCLKKMAAEGKPFEQDVEVRTNQLYSMRAGKIFGQSPECLFTGDRRQRSRNSSSRFPDVIWTVRIMAPSPDWCMAERIDSDLLDRPVVRYGAEKNSDRTHVLDACLGQHRGVSLDHLPGRRRTRVRRKPSLDCAVLCDGNEQSGRWRQERLSHSRLSRYGALGLIVAAALFVAVPWMAHRFSPIGAMVGDSLIPKRDEALVFGGRRMSGFLVVEDDLPLSDDVPMIHLADFAAIITQSNVEFHQEQNRR